MAIIFPRPSRIVQVIVSSRNGSMATVKEYDALSPCGTLSDVPMEDVCELRVFTDDGTLYVEDYRKI